MAKAKTKKVAKKVTKAKKPLPLSAHDKAVAARAKGMSKTQKYINKLKKEHK